MPTKRPDSPYWWISYKDPQTGKRIRESSSTTVRKDAVSLENRLRYESHQAEKFGVEPTRTFDQLLLAYLQTHSLGRSAYAGRTLYQHFSGMPLNSLSRTDITAYIQSRKVKPATIRRELGILKAAINWANKDLGWSIPNLVYLPPKSEGKLRWLTKQEYHALITAAGDSHLTPMICFAVNTGLRSGELLSLRWEQIHGDTVIFQADQVKSRKNQSVPLNTSAMSVLAQVTNDHPEYVFTYRGRPVKDIKKAFATACKKAQLENVSPHTLRHTCASWMVQAGVSLAIVKEVMRHSSIEMTMRYAHLAPDSARAGVTALESVTGS